MTSLTRKTTLVPLLRLGAVAAALLILTVLIIGRSAAAFSDTTDNTGNTFAAGTVVITDDDGGSAMFTASGMRPDDPVTRCIVLTYSGTNVPADIRGYGTSSGTLAQYLDLTIEEGTGGTFADCTGFTPSSTIFNNTLQNYSTTHTDWSTGLATFTAASNPTSRTLRFTFDVQSNDAAQGQSASATFTWEAQD